MAIEGISRATSDQDEGVFICLSLNGVYNFIIVTLRARKVGSDRRCTKHRQGAAPDKRLSEGV